MGCLYSRVILYFNVKGAPGKPPGISILKGIKEGPKGNQGPGGSRELIPRVESEVVIRVTGFSKNPNSDPPCPCEDAERRRSSNLGSSHSSKGRSSDSRSYWYGSTYATTLRRVAAPAGAIASLGAIMA